MDTYYPDWHQKAILEDQFPWARGVTTTLPRLLALYTLHDSTWITLKLDLMYDGYALAAFRFDAFWTQGRVPHPGGNVAHWPILLIRIHEVSQIQLRGFSQLLGMQRSIAEADSHAIGDIYHTSILDIYGGECQLQHRGPVDVLCLSRTSEVLPLADLSAAAGTDGTPPAPGV